MKAASLTSSLLAPKGDAAPAHLHQVYPLLDGRGERAASEPARVPANRPIQGDDEAAMFAPAAATSEDDISPLKRDRLGRVKLSLRLDAERHTRLRLAAAHTGRRLQDVLTAALDSYLSEIAPTLQEHGCTCYPSGAANHED